MAKSSFDTAVESLEAVDLGQLGGLLSFFSEMLCEIGERPKASDHWFTAAEAAQENDQTTAEENIIAGWRLMAECHSG